MGGGGGEAPLFNNPPVGLTTCYPGEREMRAPPRQINLSLLDWLGGGGCCIFPFPSQRELPFLCQGETGVGRDQFLLVEGSKEPTPLKLTPPFSVCSSREESVGPDNLSGWVGCCLVTTNVTWNLFCWGGEIVWELTLRNQEGVLGGGPSPRKPTVLWCCVFPITETIGLIEPLSFSC